MKKAVVLETVSGTNGTVGFHKAVTSFPFLLIWSQIKSVSMMTRSMGERGDQPRGEISDRDR